MKKILLSSPHMSDEGYEREYVKEAFDTNWIAPLGFNVDNFEKEISEMVEIGSAAALNSGTAALHLALKAAGVKKGDKVFCSSLTFSASANPIVYEGAEPIFIDSERKTWNMDPKCLKKAFETFPDVKVVIFVHLYGQPGNMEEILNICKKHNAILIEDAAESLGSKYKNKHTGTFGHYGIYSFNGNKIITTSGGGMVVSNDKEKISKIRFWSTQSKENAIHYEHKEIGYNYRMSNIVAGIGRGQLKVLDARINKKRKIYEKYKEAFENIPEIEIPIDPIENYSNHWLSVILLTNVSKVLPNELIKMLNENNIEARHVWKPMHMQPVFQRYDFVYESKDSISEDLFQRGICLPSDTKMTEEEQQKVIDIILESIKK